MSASELDRASEDPRADPRGLLASLRGQTRRMQDLLFRLAAAESPSLEPEAHRPVHALLSDELRARGFRVRHVPGRATAGHLLAVPRGGVRGRPVQLLVGHSDTVWPRGAQETMPIRLEDGRLYGPGVFDMKGGLAQMLFALEVAAEMGPPEVAPVVFIGSDEEIGSPESSRWLRRLAGAAERVFVVEPPLGPTGALKTARKGVAEFTVRVSGRAAHAGLDPERGISAVHELAQATLRLAALADPTRGTSVNVGVVHGGLRPNVVAPEARAEVDARAFTLPELMALEEAIRGVRPATAGASITVEGGIVQPPMERTEGTARLWELAREAGAELGLRLEEATVGGGSDGNTTSPFAPTLDGLGAVGHGAHSTDEHVLIAAMPERAALLTLLLLAPSLARSG